MSHFQGSTFSFSFDFLTQNISCREIPAILIALVGESWYKTKIQKITMEYADLSKKYELVVPIFKYPVCFGAQHGLNHAWWGDRLNALASHIYGAPLCGDVLVVADDVNQVDDIVAELENIFKKDREGTL